MTNDDDLTPEEFDILMAEGTPVDVTVSLAKTYTHTANTSPDPEAYRRGFEFGLREMNTQIHMRLQDLLSEAITSERKNALEKAIQAVEELAP